MVQNFGEVKFLFKVFKFFFLGGQVCFLGCSLTYINLKINFLSSRGEIFTNKRMRYKSGIKTLSQKPKSQKKEIMFTKQDSNSWNCVFITKFYGEAIELSKIFFS